MNYKFSLKNQARKSTKYNSIRVVFSLTIVALTLFSVFSQCNINSSSNLQMVSDNTNYQNNPLSAEDSEYGDFDGISPNKIRDKNGVGNITLKQLFLDDYGLSPIDDRLLYPLGTLYNASFIDFTDNKGFEIVKNCSEYNEFLTVKLNETIGYQIGKGTLSDESAESAEFDTYEELYENLHFQFLFRPYFSNARLTQVYYKNGTTNETAIPVDEDDFSTVKIVQNNLTFNRFKYNFSNNFYNQSWYYNTSNSQLNFTLTYIYEIDLDFTIEYFSSDVVDYLTSDNIIDEVPITKNFEHSIVIHGTPSIGDFRAEFSLILSDPDDIYNVNLDDALINNEQNFLSTHGDLTALGTYGVKFLDYTPGDEVFSFQYNSAFTNLVISEIYFDTDFIITFIDEADSENYWFEDKLLDNLDIRVRNYKIKVIDGPEKLPLENIRLNITSIYFNELLNLQDFDLGVISNPSSALQRTVGVENMNYSTGGAYVVPSPDDTNSTTPEYPEGITIMSSSYLIYNGDVDVISIFYYSTSQLKLTITDKITNALPNYKANIYYGDVRYGPKMSKFDNVQLPTKMADSKGRITVYNVPRGNYTVEIVDADGNVVQLLDADGNVVENVTAFADVDVDMTIIRTNKEHFPKVIIILGFASAIMMVIGFRIYKKTE